MVEIQIIAREPFPFIFCCYCRIVITTKDVCAIFHIQVKYHFISLQKKNETLKEYQS